MILLDAAITTVAERIRAFEREAHTIFAVHERSASRVVFLDESYRELKRLSADQDELLRQALRCTEQSLFRAAHVMAWAALMDLVQSRLASDGFAKLRSVRAKWLVSSVDELREQITEYQQIEACKPAGLCSKNEVKALHGMLNKRNECAHPSDFYPDLNETLGYLTEIMRHVRLIQGRTPS